MADSAASWNSLYIEWLQQLWVEAQASNQPNKPFAYKRARETLLSCPKQFQHPSELAELKFFGPAICTKLEKMLEKHCSAKGIAMPERSSSCSSTTPAAPRRGRTNPSSSTTDSVEIIGESRAMTGRSRYGTNTKTTPSDTPDDTTQRSSQNSQSDPPRATLSARNPYRTTETSTPDFSTGGIGRSRPAAAVKRRNNKTASAPDQTQEPPQHAKLSTSNPYRTTATSTPDFATSGIGSQRAGPGRKRKAPAQASNEPISIHIDNDPPTANSQPKPAKRQRTTKSYVPQFRSGAYAILITLYHHWEMNHGGTGMTKQEIIDVAQPLSKESVFDDPHSGRYSAWNSIKTLINKGLVYKSLERNAHYSVTVEGRDLASTVLQAERTDAPGLSSQTAAPSSSFSQSAANTMYDEIVDSDEDHNSEDDELVEINNIPEPVASTSATFATPSRQAPIPINASNSSSINPGGLQEAWRKERANLTPNSQVRAELRRLGLISYQNASPNTQSATVLPDSSPLAFHNTPSSQQNASTEYDELLDTQDGQYDRMIWKPDDYDVEMIIDNREIRNAEDRSFFLKKLNDNGVRVQELALSVGDAIWIARHRATRKIAVLDFIMERKRLDDLVASIKDGRFSEQKQRLKTSGLGNVTYLIEESNLNDRSGLIGQQIATSLSQSIVVDGFFLKRTASPESTAMVLVSITEFIIAEYASKDLYVIVPQITTPSSLRLAMLRARRKLNLRNDKAKGTNLVSKKDFSESQQSLAIDFQTFQAALSKSGMKTIRLTFIRMLLVIKGVTLEKANMIQNVYPTPAALLDAYDKLGSDEEAKKDLLFKQFGSNIAKFRVRKELSETIYLQWGRAMSELRASGIN